jgi:cation diffusion facilitator CzcD-associated flavoprotein CzcO
MSLEHFDVLIVGAGISGIGAGCHLQKRCPGRSYAILEGRADIGGTWDLFRYPGIRSDSDMYTLGYSFRPWTQAKAIADGPAILDYLKDTAKTYGIDQRIRFGHRVKSAAWSSQDSRWTVARARTATRAGALHVQLPVHVQRLLQLCRGLHAAVPGRGAFRGSHRASAEVD